MHGPVQSLVNRRNGKAPYRLEDGVYLPDIKSECTPSLSQKEFIEQLISYDKIELFYIYSMRPQSRAFIHLQKQKVIN